MIAGALLLAAAAAPLTPARYKAVVAPITNCREFERRFAALPYAAPLLRRLFGEGIPQQSPAENADAFTNRVVDRLFARLGDPSRIYASMPLGQAARYDSARGVLVVTFPVPYEASLDAPREDGPGDAPVPAMSDLKGVFEFPPGVLPETVELKMTPAESWRFRNGGGRLQVISLFQDYGTDQATSTARRTDYRLVRLTPKCALISNAGVAVPGWRYDGWDAVSAE